MCVQESCTCFSHPAPRCIEAVRGEAPVLCESDLHKERSRRHSLRRRVRAWQLSKLLLLGAGYVCALEHAYDVGAALCFDVIEKQWDWISSGINHPFTVSIIWIVWCSRPICQCSRTCRTYTTRCTPCACVACLRQNTVGVVSITQ